MKSPSTTTETIGQALKRISDREILRHKKDDIYRKLGFTEQSGLGHLRGIPCIGRDASGASPGTRPDQSHIYFRDRSDARFDRNDMSANGNLAAAFSGA